MHIGFIGDVHLNAGRRHSQYNGINIYKTLLGALDQARNLIPSDEIYFLGDIFDKYSHYDEEVIDFIKWVQTHPNTNFYTITGNHDTSKKKFWNVEYNKYNVLHIVEKACPNFHIIDINKGDLTSYGIYNKEKVRIFGLPYFEYESEFLNALKYVAQVSSDLRKDGWKTVLLMHQNLEKYIRLSTIQHNDLLFSNFDLTINGHIHSPQWVLKDKFLLQGSLITSTKSDESSEKKNVSVLNLSTFKLQRKTLQGLPEFKYYKQGDDVKNEDRNNFIIWEADSKVVTIAAQKQESFNNLPYREILDSFCEQNMVDKNLLNNLELSVLDSEVDNAHIDLKFKEITIEGFGSYVNPVTYDLSTDGITWIRGLPGSGKSTIFKAFNWALEGRYYNKENAFADPTSKESWASLSSTGYRGCRVQLSFTRNGEEHLIIRHRNFKGESLGKKGKNYVHIYKRVDDKWEYINLDKMYEGEFDAIHAALSRNNDKIMKYLGINPDMIKYTMIVSPEYFDLISKKQADVRDVFYSLIDLSWIDDLDKQLYTKLKDAEKEQQEIKHKKDILETELEGVVARIDDQEKSYTIEMNRYDAQNKSLQAQKDIIDEKCKLYKETIKAQSKYLKQHDVARMGWYEQKYPQDKERLERLESQLDSLIDQKQDFQQELDSIEAPVIDEKVHYDAVHALEIKRPDINKIRDVNQLLTEDESNRSTYGINLSKKSTKLEYLKAEHNKLLAEFGNTYSVCPTCGTDISNAGEDYRKHIEKHLKALGEKVNDNERKQQELQLSIDSITKSLEIANERIELNKGRLREFSTERDAIDAKISKLKADFRAKKSETDAVKQRVVTTRARLDKLVALIESKTKEIVQLKESFKDVPKLAQDFSAYKSCHLKLVRAEKALKDSDSVLKVVKDQLNLLRSGKPTKKNITELKKRQTYLNKNIRSLHINLTNIEQLVGELHTLKKTTFHARGIKPFAISFYLDYLNSACAPFAEIAGIKLTTSLNDSGNFEFTVVIDDTTMDGKELSKGWTTFSNLVLLGGLTQMREINVMSNILGVDEPFSTVPEESVPTIMNLIRNMSYNKCLHVIAHSSMLEAQNARFIDVIGGISKVKRTLPDGSIKQVNIPSVSSFL